MFPGQVFWALIFLGAPGPLLRLVGGDWTLGSSCPGPGVVVILEVHVAPLHVPWWQLHVLWVLDSRRQRREHVVSLHAVHLYTRKDKTNQEFLLYGGRQHFSELKSLVVYLRGWSDEFIHMLDTARGRVALVCQIEQLPNLAYDFVMVQILRTHPRLVGRALVLVPGVHPPLARLHTPANEVPGHSRFV
jgi:hypothetical protein